jgi:hypothetical protein
MVEDMATAPEWTDKLAANARDALDELKSGLELRMQIRVALSSVGAQSHLNQSE